MLENRLADHHMAAPAVLLLVDPDLRLLARTDPSAATRPIESHILCEDGRISGLGQLDGPRLAAVCQESLLSPEPHQHVLTLVQDSPISLLATFNGLAAYAGLAPPCLLIQLRLREDAPHLRCRDLASRYRLTRTQSRILAALVEGLDPQTIARQHRISLPTVRTHLQHLREKLGCHKTSELILRVLDPAQAVLGASDHSARDKPENHQK